jgi:hypothetical protein
MQELKWLLRQYSDVGSKAQIIVEFFISQREFRYRYALERWISNNRRKQTLLRRVYGYECA